MNYGNAYLFSTSLHVGSLTGSLLLGISPSIYSPSPDRNIIAPRTRQCRSPTHRLTREEAGKSNKAQPAMSFPFPTPLGRGAEKLPRIHGFMDPQGHLQGWIFST